MQQLPHHYQVAAEGEPAGNVTVTANGLPALATDAPAEFGGPGDRWSPETLMMAAVADCFILSFRAVARASGFAWEALSCDVTGVLDKQDGVIRFTELVVRPSLTLPDGADGEKAQRLLEKAKKVCLISNSMTADTRLETDIREVA
ncbi:MAG: OsmC family protein [Ectothiorhodospiraceae bacterium]|nr:OsmC family protein [Ectothiorhodospiraceae bacterium]